MPLSPSESAQLAWLVAAHWATGSKQMLVLCRPLQAALVQAPGRKRQHMAVPGRGSQTRTSASLSAKSQGSHVLPRGKAPFVKEGNRGPQQQKGVLRW